jgi:hypothetical protein
MRLNEFDLEKQPVDVVHRAIKFDAWLCEGETITEVEARPEYVYDDGIVFPDLKFAHLLKAPLRAYSMVLADKKSVGLVISNGIDGDQKTVEFLIHTSDGRRVEHEFFVTVKEI